MADSLGVHVLDAFQDLIDDPGDLRESANAIQGQISTLNGELIDSNMQRVHFFDSYVKRKIPRYLAREEKVGPF